MFTALRDQDYKMWNYLQGTYDKSILSMRREHLRKLLLFDDSLKISAKNFGGDGWTKWLSYYKTSNEIIDLGYDLHRSLLPFEIVVESDYPDYQDNWEAARMYGQLLESKGWLPNYYYSGSKSIHIHCYLDYRAFDTVPDDIMRPISEHYRRSLCTFIKHFTEYIRTQIISCYGTKARLFDTQLKKETHLIRAELSRNKLGFKTLIGQTYKDLIPFPILCNEINGKYPEIGEIRLSIPNDLNMLLKDFSRAKIKAKKKAKEKDRENALLAFFGTAEPKNEALASLITFIESDKFKDYSDGYNRCAYILVNYYKSLNLDHNIIAQKVISWNQTNGNNLTEYYINYMIEKQEPYPITEKYVRDLLYSLGVQDEALAQDIQA